MSREQDADFFYAIHALMNGHKIRYDDEMIPRLVKDVHQPNGTTMDRLMRNGWLKPLPNGGTFVLSHEGVTEYLAAVLDSVQSLEIPLVPDDLAIPLKDPY